MPDMGSQIIDKAKELGAAMAGLAAVEALKKSPSHEILKTVGTKIDGVYAVSNAQGFREINWPEAAASALVLAVAHPENRPELDWYDAREGSPGNKELIRINRELSAWIENIHGIKTHRMAYQVEDGGIYLKDAAVLAGLGCVGRNNLLITKKLGPQLRFRGMLLEVELTPTGPEPFDPCDGCEEPCREVCPHNALAEVVRSFADHDSDGARLP
jgi:epoxyqueuosine reductase